MKKLKKWHIVSKTIFQMLLLLAEITVIVGGMVWFSNKYLEIISVLDLLERIGLFYGFYQIIVYITLSTINDIKTDEYIALKNCAFIALKTCEYNDNKFKEVVYSQIDKQLDSGTFNDLLVRKNYVALKQYVKDNNKKYIEYMIIWAEHCAETANLQWKFSFLLRLFK